MAEQTQDLSPDLKRLAEAIRADGGRARGVLCGYDLWIDVLSSPHITLKDFVQGGVPASGEEDKEKDCVVPLIVLGGRIVVGLDITLAPNEFVLRV